MCLQCGFMEYTGVNEFVMEDGTVERSTWKLYCGCETLAAERKRERAVHANALRNP